MDPRTRSSTSTGEILISIYYLYAIKHSFQSSSRADYSTIFPHKHILLYISPWSHLETVLPLYLRQVCLGYTLLVDYHIVMIVKG